MSLDPPAPADVIDTAAGLAPGHPLFEARRFRATVVTHTQASHDALLDEPVEGLSTVDRLQVAVACCDAAGATTLAAHYRARLAACGAEASDSPALGAMQAWAIRLTRDPRQADRAALQTLKAVGLGDPAIVALAQLVAFLSYQTRVIAGLRALGGGARSDGGTR